MLQTETLISEVWSVRLLTTGPVIAFEAGFEECAGATALALSKADDGRHCLDAWFDKPPEEALIARIITAGKTLEQAVDWQIIHYPLRDWLAENRANFPPLTIGRFWIYGSHVRMPLPAAKKILKIDAAQAFGSGTHPTTEGCLHAFHKIERANKGRAMLCRGRILDLGCGSAILAMAAHRMFPSAKILAVDNHVPSVVSARENVRQNEISQASLRVHFSHGCAVREIQTAAPYQLIFANILAAPLRQLAPILAALLAFNGYLILSGMLAQQRRFVMQAYEARGLCLTEALPNGDWITLTLRHKSAIRASGKTGVR